MSVLGHLNMPYCCERSKYTPYAMKMTHKLWQTPVSQILIHMRTSNGVLNLLNCLAIVWGQTVDSLVSFKPYAEKHLWFKKFSEWNNRWSSVTNLWPCVTWPFLTYYISLVLSSCKWKDRALKKKKKKRVEFFWNFKILEWLQSNGLISVAMHFSP